MGHTGTLFACEQEDVVPDFLCLAKGLTGGYMPLAATITSGKIFQAFLGSFAESKTFFHGHTYGGNPLGAAAALATLEILEDERILEKMKPKVTHLQSRLERIAEHPHVGDVRQRGLIVGIELVKDKQTKEPFPWEEKRGWKVCEAALERGVWVRPLGSVVPIFPALTITTGELDQIVEAIEYGLSKVFDA
jgi:adenosylmethionine-8-amino-7-oxononanoate aminotransferase